MLTVTSLSRMTSILSYLRSSGIVRGGWRPSPNNSFEKDDILVAARAVKEVKWLKRRCTVRDTASWFWTRRGFFFNLNYALKLYNAL